MGSFDKFFEAYVECALWSSTDEDGESLDFTYMKDDLPQETLDALEADCKDFVLANYELLAKHGPPSQCGHDFWLTRNGHGAGFWDRGTGEVGTKLTCAAKFYGTCDLYIGDNGEVYVA